MKNQKKDILKALFDKSNVVLNISKSNYGKEEVERKMRSSNVEYHNINNNIFEFLYKNYRDSTKNILLLDITENGNLAYVLLKPTNLKRKDCN